MCERNVDGLLLLCVLMGDCTRNLGKRPDRLWNWWPFCLRGNAQPSHTGQGMHKPFFKIMLFGAIDYRLSFMLLEAQQSYQQLFLFCGQKMAITTLSFRGHRFRD